MLGLAGAAAWYCAQPKKAAVADDGAGANSLVGMTATELHDVPDLNERISAALWTLPKS